MLGAVVVKRSFVLASLFVLSLFLALNTQLLSGAEPSATNRLSTDTLHTKKVADLASNQEPFSMGIECSPTDFNVGFNNDGPQLHGCAYETPVGTVANSYILRGEHGTLPLNGHIPPGPVLPSPPGYPGTVMTTYYPPIYGTVALQASPYNPSLFQYKELWGVPMIYEYQYQAVNPVTLSDVRGVSPLLLASVSYSQNGEWLVAVRNDGAIEQFDTTSWKGKVIAWEKGLYFNETGAMNLAIDNTGQYIALNSFAANSTSVPTLKVYDANTCQDLSQNTTNQNGRLPSSVRQCEYNDLWNGVFRGASYGDGLKAQLPGVEYPRHLRFVGNNVLSFDSVYDRVSATEFEVGSYQISSSDFSEPPVSLLGMGDSYISGEGAFGYRVGTDTENNKCHTSIFSYPYIIGTKMFAQFNSVACSGAKMYDIEASLSTPLGQTTDTEEYGGQTVIKEKWQIRDTVPILESYSPGYANQKLFSDKYKPQDVLLSIGGNDVHFADIVKTCVSPTSIETCYGTADSRQQLMQSIIDRYDDLVQTYRTVADSSGGRVFVVGYPQIAKPDGNCGNNVNLNGDEVKFSAYLIEFLDSVLARAASDAGVIYVDTQYALNGYRLCEAPKGQAAVNGFTVGKDSGVLGAKFIGQESYHPTAFGHQLLAEAILTKTNNLTTPMPAARTNLGKPAIDPNDPLLQNVPWLNYTNKTLVWMPVNNGVHVVTKGAKYTFTGAKNIVKAGSQLSLVIHSEPITLAEGKAGDNLIVQIPKNIETGFHTLDIYGTDTNDQEVDVRQLVYVASEGDLTAPCMGMPPSGVDSDSDGIDDACDAAPDNPEIPGASQNTAGGETDNMLALVSDQDNGAASSPENSPATDPTVVVERTAYASGNISISSSAAQYENDTAISLPSQVLSDTADKKDNTKASNVLAVTDSTTKRNQSFNFAVLSTATLSLLLLLTYFAWKSHSS